MMPVRRDLRFNLPQERACDWHVQGSHVTHFFNALSLLFPAGERFFMDSVRNYRDQIDDPVLKKQVLGFIGQEAMHTREHVEYNDLLQEAGLPAHGDAGRLAAGRCLAHRRFGRRLYADVDVACA
jgi:predicted metal-dependent hydrolase